MRVFTYLFSNLVKLRFHILFTYLFGIISTYALLCSVIYETFQGPNAWIYAPYKRLSLEVNNEINTDHIFQEGINEEPSTSVGLPTVNLDDKREKFFIFVLDVSLSVAKDSKQEILIEAPFWVHEIVNRIEDKNFLELKDMIDKDKNKIPISNLAKLQLYKMLLDISHIDSDDKFSIWTVGNTGERIYPEKKGPAPAGTAFAKMDSPYINYAADIIQKKKSTERKTDFEDLFNKIQKAIKII